MSQLTSVILDALRANGICTKIISATSESSGLNNAFKLRTDSGDIFVKINNDKNSQVMFEGEKESLEAISEAVPGFAPKPLCVGTLPNGGAFLVTTFLQISGSPVQELFARKLAQLHSTYSPNGKFGFSVATMCGTTEQDNTWENDWETFFRERRLKSMIDKCLKKYSSDFRLRELGEIVINKVIHYLLQDIEVKPVLIHGDLWSGNWGVNTIKKEPIVYDPCSYYGHNEMELSILTMFGSPGPIFFKEYHKHHPRQEPRFEDRQGLNSFE
ncbi:hypothetical protein Glove_167g82 [Diversispora epigaea]|uniref:protein-ribulosamine 3-kinase n=1 Tax=Diversispora epigaea TaxID=1348612 RepID=A0A397IWH6_9GLOM|nr:hypothetical protein Glove_167g82 [Diversispora epigaea]